MSGASAGKKGDWSTGGRGPQGRVGGGAGVLGAVAVARGGRSKPRVRDRTGSRRVSGASAEAGEEVGS